jgi:two-component system phosphate regulon sensor histidine kinase PhoR
MLVIDLKWIVALTLTMLGVAGALGYALAGWVRRRGARQSAHWRHFDLTPFGVFVSDRFTPEKSIYSNGVARAFLGDGSGEWLKPLYFELLRSAREPGRTTLISLTSPSGASARAWIFGTDDIAIAILLDATDQRHGEARAREYVGLLSHELRTPLTAIVAHAQIARSEELPADTRAASLTLLEQEAHRMTRLIRDLGTLSRINADVVELDCDVDVVLVAEDAISTAILDAEARGIALDLIAMPDLPRVCANRDRLRQVFTNLLDNAVKYCRPGDTIRVSLSKQEQLVHCEVSDTGPGITPEHRAHVVERLYRGRRDVDGSGLGLAIVQAILHTHRSALEIQSLSNEDGKGPTGTTMVFMLPTAHAVATQ